MCKEVLKYDELLAEKLRAFMKDIDFYYFAQNTTPEQRLRRG